MKRLLNLMFQNYWPNIAAFGQYSTMRVHPMIGSLTHYSSATIGLNFTINLWQGNRTSNAVQQSTITYQQTDEQLKQLKDYTLLNVKSKLQELKRVQICYRCSKSNC
jgi:outer membrane protein TolC